MVPHKVAWKMGRYRTSQTWKIIALLFDTEEEEEEEKQSTNEQDLKEQDTLNERTGEDHLKESASEQTHAMQSQNYLTDDRDSEDEHIGERSDSDLEEEKQIGNFGDDKETSDAESSIPCSEHTELWATWQHRDVVMGLLDYYTEQVQLSGLYDMDAF
ncbi:hypothetical protein EC973_002119 [Apophysomyces ossiformis]|uniref:Uncharacterized protein n=1 Tax=Apophysomyces ossiformis TaxID=679940 RepID=A0A8H7ENW3_9FUNG|nr:hypothetical protein EC973_002119 [Apophysomyces ossiformis]